MTPQELAKEAQLFLDFYIQGSSEAVEAYFPNAHKPGIRFRKPAVLGIRPEFTPLPQPDAGELFDANAGPEPSEEPYRFVDRCSLQRAKVTAAENGGLKILFVFVNRFPAGTLPGEETLKETALLPFSNGVADAILFECITRLEEYLGSDDRLKPTFLPEIELLSLEDLNQRVSDGDL